MFNSYFLPMDSTNSNVHFHFDVLRHRGLFCFVINAADTCKYAMNKTHAFCAMDDIVKHSVLRSIKTKTVQIRTFFPVKKGFKSYPSYMYTIAFNKFIKDKFSFPFDTLIVVSFEFFFKCKFSLVTTVLSKRELKITTVLLHSKSAVFYQSRDWNKTKKSKMTYKSGTVNSLTPSWGETVIQIQIPQRTLPCEFSVNCRHNGQWCFNSV